MSLLKKRLLGSLLALGMLLTALPRTAFAQDQTAPIAGAPASITLTPEADVIAAGSWSYMDVTGKVSDTAGNGVSGVAVAFSLSTYAFGYVDPEETVTAADGTFHTTFHSSRRTGTFTIVATVVGTDVTASTTIRTVIVGDPARITISPAFVTVDGTATMTGRVTDYMGNPIAHTFVYLAVTGGSIPAMVKTNARGEFAAVYTAPDAVGLQSVTASIDPDFLQEPFGSAQIHVVPADMSNHPQHPEHPLQPPHPYQAQNWAHQVERP